MVVGCGYWRFHSLHHSEERLNATTAMRQHWLDALIRSFVIYPVVGVIFHADSTVIFVARVLTLLNNAQAHMGTRRDSGRLWWLLNSPQYHRCHHSIEPHCIGRNLAAMFPLWDILFGTCYKPAPQRIRSNRIGALCQALSGGRDSLALRRFRSIVLSFPSP
jgi:sterol desaturase/sphingolipid hydroxylase (fatty acid hydroxylase superfamily)